MNGNRPAHTSRQPHVGRKNCFVRDVWGREGSMFSSGVCQLAGWLPPALLATALFIVCGDQVRGEQPPTAVTPPAAAAAAKPGPNDRQITLAVRSYLEREHFLRHPIDDEIAKRWFTIFLEGLDPWKLHFLQSDIDGFMQKRDGLDDAVKRGDVSFAYEVYNRFLERLDARLPLVEKLVNGAQDYAKQESIVIDRDAATWAKSEAEAEDSWRKRIKYDLLVQKMEKTSAEESKDKLLRRYRSFAKRMHQMTADELLEMYLTALTSSLDPHTSFMSPGTQENFAIAMRLQLDGIGAQLKGEDGYTTIMELTPGGAADRDGRLKKKDRVVGVGQGADGEMVDVVDTNLNEVVKLIRGKRGTLVRLKVIPVGETVPKIYDITRAKIELKDAEARGEVIEEGRKPDGTPWRIGVINLPSFYMDMDGARQGQADYKSSTRDCKRLLDEFRQKGVDCVVLDLRNNGGGSLPESISLTGLFIDTGPVVQIKDAAVRRRRSGRVVGRSVRGAHQQVQRQCQRDRGGRHPGLPPRPRHRRQVDAWEGNRAEPARPRSTALSAAAQCPVSGGNQDHHAAVLQAVGCEHAARGCQKRCRTPQHHHAPAGWRVGSRPRHCLR